MSGSKSFFTKSVNPASRDRTSCGRRDTDTGTARRPLPADQSSLAARVECQQIHNTSILETRLSLASSIKRAGLIEHHPLARLLRSSTACTRTVVVGTLRDRRLYCKLSAKSRGDSVG